MAYAARSNRHLRGRIWRHQPVGPAILIDRRTPHHRQHPIPVAQRIGRRLSTTTPQPSPRTNPSAAASKAWHHPSTTTHRPDRNHGKPPATTAGSLPRRWRDRSPASAGSGMPDAPPPATTNTPYPPPPTGPQIEKVRQPIGDDAQRTAGSCSTRRLDPDRWTPGTRTRRCMPDEDPGLRVAQRTRRESRRAPRPPTPLPATGAAGDPSWPLREAEMSKNSASKASMSVKNDPHRVVRARTAADLRGSVIERRPPISRHLGYRGAAVRQELPQRVRAGDLTGETASQTDHSDRLVHAASTGSTTDSSSASGSAPLRNRANSVMVGWCQNSTGETGRPSSSENSPESTTESRDPTPRSFIEASRSISRDSSRYSSPGSRSANAEIVLVEGRCHAAIPRRLNSYIHQIPLSLPAGADSTLSNKSSSTLLSESGGTSTSSPSPPAVKPFGEVRR